MRNTLVYAEGAKLWCVELAPPAGGKVGWIEERNDGRFHVIAGIDDDPSRSSPLWGVDHGPHQSLADARAAIPYRLGSSFGVAPKPAVERSPSRYPKRTLGRLTASHGLWLAARARVSRFGS